MKIDEFIKGYNESPDLFLQEHVKRVYVPLTAKVVDCKTIIRQSYYETDKNTGIAIYSPNRVLANYLFEINLLKRYTDIEELSDKGLEIYDKLAELNILEDIKRLIDAHELARYAEIFNSAVEETNAKETNIMLTLRNLTPVLANVVAELEKRGVGLGEEVEP